MLHDKIRAFGLHALLSTFAATLGILVVFGLWYPPPLNTASGVTRIFLIVLAVDVVLGPLLTFVVFKRGKKTLKFDLAIIATLQIAALCYGMWTVAQGRPAWVVFATDRFELVREADVDPAHLSQAPAAMQPGWLGPKWVAAIAPQDSSERIKILFESISGGLDMAYRPYLYHPLDAHEQLVKSRVKPLDELKKFNSPADVEATLKQFPEAAGWVPLMAPNQPMVVLLPPNSGKALAVVPLAPWH